MTKEEAFIKACKEAGYDKDEVNLNDVFMGEFEYENDFRDMIVDEFLDSYRTSKDSNEIIDNLSCYINKDKLFKEIELDMYIENVGKYYFDFSRA